MTSIATLTTARPNTEWFATWFDSAHYHRLYANRDQDEASAFVDRLITQLAPTPGARALDLGCGSGRHARRLASRGFDVTGIDLSAGSLARARSQPSPHVAYLEQDMREPFGTRTFDIVFNLFTSFGYFRNRIDHATVVSNIAASLRDGGVLVLDYLNAIIVERQLVRHEVVERDEVRYHLTRWSDAEAFYKRIVIEDPHLAAPLEYVERVANLTLLDFQRLFARAGLTIERVYGDYNLNSFDRDTSPRLILIATNTRRLAGRLAPRQMLPDPAERLRGHAEVGREHRLRHALNDRRIGLQKLQIPLFRSRAERADNAIVLGGGVTLQAGTKRGGEWTDMADQVLMRRTVDEQDFGGLDRLVEVGRGSAGAQTLRVSQPPGFRRELDDVLPALGIDDEVAQAAAGNKRGVAADVAGALQEFTGSQASEDERGANHAELGVGERRTRFEVRTEHAEG